jgi:sulfate transport system permease protein
MVVLPVATIAREGLARGPRALGHAIWHPVARAALALTLETALIMAVVNAVMGTLIAYVLVRYRFPGRKLLDLVIDLPFAIPTLVTGMMLVALLGPRTALGQLFEAAGLRIVYAPPVIILALLFVTLPLVVRSVQPVLLELDVAEEEAAYTLGASEWTAFRRVTLPALAPAVLGGALQSFARALGEFGSIVVVAGNIPRRTLTAAVHVFGEVESGDVHAASAMSLLLVTISFSVVLGVDAYERRRRRHG